MAWRTLLGVLAICACGCGPALPSPCATDRFGCGSSTEGFTLLEGCTLTEPLAVEMGYGQTTFTPLLSEALLPVYTGTQGGQHTFLGVRVANAALDRYDKLEVHYLLTSVEPIACDEWNAIPGSDVISSDAGSSDDSDDSSSGSGTCVRKFGERTVVLGQGAKIKKDAKGAVVEVGLVVFLSSWPGGAPLNVDMTVRDPCGRVSSAHVVARP